MTRRPIIGVFDSGMGGVTVLSALQQLVPSASYLYAFDNAHFPYGNRPEGEVIQLVLVCLERLIQVHRADIVVIACNTASVSALAPARARFSVPMIGTVPAIKPAAAQSRTKTIGLLATPATVLRPYTDALERQLAQDCVVLRRGSVRLVELAERKMHGEPVPLQELWQELRPLFEASPSEEARRLDTIVLGCTHFPLLSDEIRAVVPWPVHLIDPGPAIAARARAVIAEAGFAVDVAEDAAKTIGPIALATLIDGDIESLRPTLARLGFAGIEPL